MASLRIVVAGAAGFIGRHVMQAALERSVGAVGLSRRDLPGLVRIAGAGDLPTGDVCIHLAQQSHRGLANERSQGEEDAELAFSQALIEAYPTVILASTALVYGDRSHRPHTESDPVDGSDRYISAKLSNERAVTDRGGVIMRLTNVYGPGQSQSSVVKDLIDRGRATGVVSTKYGAPVRDFVYVEDVAAALMAAAMRPTPGVFNVATGQGTAIAELARTIAELMKLDLSVASSPAGESSTIIADPRRAIEQWNLAAPRSLRSGLSATIGELQ